MKLLRLFRREATPAETARARLQTLVTRERVRPGGPEFLPRLKADRRALIQILVNLLSNAIKFTPEEGEIGVKAGVMEDGAVELSVIDNGVGMPRSELALVLRPFGQAEASLRRQNQGTGLGLPLSQSLVELHGGRFAIDSEVGEGTKVTIWFPRKRSVWTDKAERED